ncbi:MAG: YciI family protein [Bacteroidetes bacterium]|nr:YciI family protein [Bacteroidota bacterium]
MTTITDDFMRQRLSQARNYTIVILKKTSRTSEQGADKIIWEHGRRNMAMNADGLLPVVCPVNDGTDLAGVGIFDASVEETLKILDDDPGVKAGLFTFELHPCRGFPGSSLP